MHPTNSNEQDGCPCFTLRPRKAIGAFPVRIYWYRSAFDVGIYRFKLQLSYVSSQFVASDPFWTFRPMNAPQTSTTAARKPVRR